VPEVYSLGYRFSFAEGRGPDEVLTAFGVDPGDAEPLTREASAEEFGVEPGLYRVGETGGWSYVVEEFGGDHDDVLRALSAGGRAVSVTKVESAMSVFEYYEDGERTLWFEPTFPLRRTGRDADRFLDAMRRVGLDPDSRPNLALIAPAVAALDMVTDLFGIRVDRETAEGLLLTGAAEPDMAWLEG
jgi:Family of unknown function (DUF6461)